MWSCDPAVWGCWVSVLGCVHWLIVSLETRTHITPQRVNREEDNKNNRSLVVSHQLWWQQRLIGLYQEEPWSTAALQTEQPHLSTSHGFHLHFHFLHMCMGSGTSLVFLNKAWLTILCRSWKNSSYPAFL